VILLLVVMVILVVIGMLNVVLTGVGIAKELVVVLRIGQKLLLLPL
jgi:hypothetical protein